MSMRQVSIRLSKQDLDLVERLQKEQGWDRSRAIRHVLKLIGKILQRVKLSEVEKMIQEETWEALPETCLKCNGTLITRIEPTATEYKIGETSVYDEILECTNCHTLYRAIYKLAAFKQLKE